jgi:glycosyltransferase involved in cell wall biosynthesis
VLILHKLNLINDIKIVLAPRGEFSKGALQFKILKKSIYIFLSKVIGLYSKISWHATASTEEEDIKRVFSDRNQIFIANNMTANYRSIEHFKLGDKFPGQLRVIFLSRIHPKKNLRTAIELLVNVKGKVEFDIYGPIEDDKYWDTCKKSIQQLPSNIVVNYKGLVANNDVVTIFKKYHVFLFPTLGENFGHVISEALIGGCIVITSNQTPWLNLEQERVGWDIPLEKTSDFSKAIQTCIDMNKAEYSEYSLNAYNFGMNKSNDIKIKDAYINMFGNNCEI